MSVQLCAYLKDILERLPTMTNHKISELTPLEWKQARQRQPALHAGGLSAPALGSSGFWHQRHVPSQPAEQARGRSFTADYASTTLKLVLPDGVSFKVHRHNL